MTRRSYGYDESESGPRLSDLHNSHDLLRESVEKLGELLQSESGFPFRDARELSRRAMKHAADIRSMLAGEGGEDEETPPDDIDYGVTPEQSKVKAGDGELPPLRQPQSRPSAILGIGTTPARSAVSLSGGRRDVDHRDDFRSGARSRDSRRGADAALPKDYDFASIVQRKP